jgi:hypothetical protein
MIVCPEQKTYEKKRQFRETKPIFDIPEMIVSVVYTMTNNKRQRTMNCQKQSQINPTCGEQRRTITSA